MFVKDDFGMLLGPPNSSLIFTYKGKELQEMKQG